MNVFDKLIDMFTQNIIQKDEKETFKEVSINVICDSISAPNKTEFQQVLSSINKRDRIYICIVYYGDEECKYSYPYNLDEFIDELHAFIDRTNDETYQFYIKILKELDNNNISIYDLDLLMNHLESLSLQGILYEFNNIIIDDYIIFRLQNENTQFSTKTFYFLPESEQVILKLNDRSQILKKRENVCNFLNASMYNFTPEDFYITGPSSSNVINKVFSKLSILFALIYIANISNFIDENLIKIIINGYTTIENIIDYRNIYEMNLRVYYDIYEWIYDCNKNNISDRIGIARNILSLNAKKNLLIIEESAKASIQSAHEIYLKDNVERYIDIKNKISEFLLSMSQKTSELANSLGKSLYGNVIAIVTYFATIIIMNSFSANKLDNIFTNDITLISLAFLLLSIIYMIISIIDTSKDKKRFAIEYSRLKHVYDEILVSDDIKNIFKNDKYFEEDMCYIKKRIRTYIVAWAIALVIMLATVIYGGFFVH